MIVSDKKLTDEIEQWMITIIEETVAEFAS
jgi:hypothetical protein